MGLFGKRITDEEWLDTVMPLYEAARPVTTALREAVNSDSMEDQISAVRDALQTLPVIAETIKGLPSPTSSAARQAKKDFEWALKDYIEGAKQGHKLFRDLTGGLGERFHYGGLARRAAAGRIEFQKTAFEETVRHGQKSTEQAAVFFSR